MTPRTLGEKLDESMRMRRQSSEEVARELGVTTSEVLLWRHDLQVPGPVHFESIAHYLFIEQRQLRGLILRTQMRRMQQRSTCT